MDVKECNIDRVSFVSKLKKSKSAEEEEVSLFSAFDSIAGAERQWRIMGPIGR